MTDYEKIVIKALKKYIKQAKEKHYEYIAEDLQDALDIINRLKAKEEKNENIIRLAEKTIEKQQAEIERLKAEADMTEGYAEALEQKARKEFAERLKMGEAYIIGRSPTVNKDFEFKRYVVFSDDIDNLLKEMESENP